VPPPAKVALAGAIWHSFAMRLGPRRDLPSYPLGCGCSSGVEHDLAKVGVEGSNPFARSSFSRDSNGIADARKRVGRKRLETI
jgi:hypothetical protein